MKPNQRLSLLLASASLVLFALGGGGVPFVPSTPGVRNIVVLREAADTTPDLARLTTALRAGEPAKYLKEKGHKLLILDDDSLDENGQPPKLLTTLLALNPPLPSLFVLNGDAVLHQGPLPASADEVLNIIKRNGG